MERRQLEAELDAAVRAARGATPLPPPLAPRLAPAVRETILGAAALAGDAAAWPLVEYYARRMPAAWVEQLVTDGGPAARLLWRRLPGERLPRLAAALAGLGVAPGDSLAALYAPTLFGGSAPLLGALADERRGIDAELAAGADPVELIDRRLAGNLVHELAHGPPVELPRPPAPWTLLEAAAGARGAWARWAHVFPDEPGEAVAGAAPFALVGIGLARLFGRGWVEGLAAAEVPEPLRVAGWQAWLARRGAPFVIDAADGDAWLKLADATREPGHPLVAAARVDGPSLLAAAERTPWAALPWWSEEPDAGDRALLEASVAALFVVNRMAPTFRTEPAELPGATFVVDVEAARLVAPPRPDGVFGEPASAPLPPPLARRMARRGVRRETIAGATRDRQAEAVAAVLRLAVP